MPKNNLDKTAFRLQLKYGIFIFLLLVLYFFVIIWLNLLSVFEWRMLNFVILLLGIYLAILNYKRLFKRNLDYLPGIWYCFITAVIGITLFALFVSIYFNLVDPRLLEELRNNSPMLGQYITPFSILITIMIEGGCSAILISFTLMQFNKNDNSHH